MVPHHNMHHTATRHPHQKSWAHRTPHTATQKGHTAPKMPVNLMLYKRASQSPPARLVFSHPPICDIWSHIPPSPSRRTSFGNYYTAPAQHQVYTLTAQLSSLDTTSQRRVSHSSLLCCPHVPTSSHGPLHLTNIFISHLGSFGRYTCCIST